MNGVTDQDVDAAGLALPTFQSVDAVQRMIQELERVKATMIREGPSEAKLPELPDDYMDDLPLIDTSETNFLVDEELWLTPLSSNADVKISVSEPLTSSEPVYLDMGLMNVRLNLLNRVKQYIKDDKDVLERKKRDDSDLHLAKQQDENYLTFARPSAVKGTYQKSPLKNYGSNPNVPRTVEKPGVRTSPVRDNYNIFTSSPAKDISALNYSPIRDELRDHSALNYSPIRDNATINYSPVRDSTFSFPSTDVTIEEPTALRPHHYLSPSGKQIDTRTYTRPKKNRKSLSVCEDFEGSNSLKEETVIKALSNTSRPEFGINDTFNVNEDCNGTSTPINTTMNLSPKDRTNTRKVTRNLSYIIRRDSDGQVNNNGQAVEPSGQGPQLSSTFTCSREEPFLSSPSDSNNSLHNISMEELHNMARLQEQSLRVTSTPKTLSRKDTQTILELPNIDERPRPPGRTSSTDTYCVVQSNPDSAESSGLSSPMDAQSYEDIQSADAVRRSMPNLAVIKGINGLRGPTLQLAPPMNSLRHKSHHISDSKLSHFVPRSSVEQRIQQTIPNPNTARIHFQNEKRTGVSYQRAAPLPYSTSGPSINNGSRIPNNNIRSGLPTPRYSSIPSREGKLPTSGRSLLPTMSTQSVPSYPQNKPQSARIQSRIPAPGAMRSRTRVMNSAGNSAKEAVGDWREGCY